MTEKTRVYAAPLVHSRAKKDGVDLSKIVGTGTNGAITVKDYEAFTGIVETVARPMKMDDRHQLNHLRDKGDDLEIAGMKFTRQKTFDHSSTKTLDFPENKKEDSLHYRWFTDQNNRVHNAQRMGYAVVEEINEASGEKITTRRYVGRGKDGAPIYSQLMATPKKWKKERDLKTEERRKSRETLSLQKPLDETGKPLGEEFYDAESRLIEE